MKRAIVVVGCLLLVAGCSDASGGRGGSAGSTATQNVSGSTVGGSVSNAAGNPTVGAGGAGGTSTQTITTNLALDPSSFASLFGNVPKIVNPTAAQIGAVAQQAAQTNNGALAAQATQCAAQPANCTIAPSQTQ
jgi:hypothetical protein